MNQCTEMRSVLDFFDVHFRAFNCTGFTLPILRVGHGEPRGSEHFKTKPRVSLPDEINGACSQRRCGESPRSKLQRVSSEDLRTPVLGQAVNQSAEVQSAMEFFATAHSFPEGCQAYKNEVYLLPTDLDEASQRTHREHSPSDVVGKVPVRSCRECHQKTADHQFVNKQWSRVSR